MIYVPRDTFIRKDLDLLFTQEFIAILKTGKTRYADQGEEGFVVLVTTLAPTETHEGMQHDFHFKKQTMDTN